MAGTPLSATINVFPPTPKLFSMYRDVVFLLLLLANLVNTLYTLAHRWWNHRSVDHYLAAINAGNPPVEEAEILTMEQLRLEALYLGLGRKKEFPSETSRSGHDCDFLAEKKCWINSRKKDSSPSRITTSTPPQPASPSPTAFH
jgi:hypothetical protein